VSLARRIVGVRFGPLPDPEPLRFRANSEGVIAYLRGDTLNVAMARRWLARLSIAVYEGEIRDAALAEPFLTVPTLAISVDRRIDSIARMFAGAAGAEFVAAAGTAEAVLATEGRAGSRSNTVFVLNDRLTHALCLGLGAAGRRRMAAGEWVRPSGFMTAFTPEQLAWLTVKTLALMTNGFPETMGFSEFNAHGGGARFQRYSKDGAAEGVPDADLRMESEETTIQSICSHGVSFDAQVGDVALCGHMDPPLSQLRMAQAPVCFHDGKCFRLNRSSESPTRVLKAVQATPMVWFLNACGAIPFGNSAFGDGTGYAFGLLAGAAVAVIGPYLAQPTTFWPNRVFEGLVTTGACLGETVVALSQAEEQADFESYILLGCPELRMFEWTGVGREGDSPDYRIQGRSRTAVRLPAPTQGACHVVADDGTALWEQADHQLVRYGSAREILLLFAAAVDIDGWVRLGGGQCSDEQLLEEAAEIRRRLGVLALYVFCAEERQEIENCKALAERLENLLRGARWARKRIYAAWFYAKLQVTTEALQERVAERFLAHVARVDFSFDRESSNGFVAGQLRISEELCPQCGDTLYLANDRWMNEESYERLKYVCANCFSVKMFLTSSPIRVVSAAMEVSVEELEARQRIEIANRTGRVAQVLAAAISRHGPAEAASGPVKLLVPAYETMAHTFVFPLDPARRGVISYRAILLCQGSAEFYSFKYGNERPMGGLGDVGAELAQIGDCPRGLVSSGGVRTRGGAEPD